MSIRVVYVHGLWLNGWESVLLRRRLARHLGCETSVFSYPSVSADSLANARRLGQYLSNISADTLHLVGHSLGGLMVLELFESVLSAEGRFANGRALPPGRIVLMGSPVQGSSAAQHLARSAFGRAVLGLTAQQVLVAPRARRWAAARDLGVIAGSLPLGFGRLAGPLQGPNDGTVQVEETRLPGATQHLILRASHSALVYSAEVARQAAAFLRQGRFNLR
ncbi:MAG TPA: alpha/beta fold hydrolase [Steroidobacteraceae bacterium]|jgi:pimeloyl-ACP methyl ester carboxylesterase|nr:alpha/beta fold hydrolase [Steroidobacteraceae bacterium]